MVDKNDPDSPEKLEFLLDHVLFPRFLPQEKTKPHHELGLMIRMIENAENLSEWLPTKTIDMLQCLKRVHIECTPSVISEEIDDLEPGP